MRDNIFSNPVFWSALLSMLVAQLAKCFIQARLDGRFSIAPLFSNGGMPSSHSATVTGLANSIGLISGYGSNEFVIACCFAMVVFNDAINVRLETGRQAETINSWSRILQEIFSPDLFKEEHFKTLVGHTKLQVLWGIIVGLITSTMVTVWF